MDAREFARFLLESGAFRIAKTESELFVIKSGRRSPIFLNAGVLTDGQSLSSLKKATAAHVHKLIEGKKLEDFEFFFGSAYKGIPLACVACEGLQELFGLNKGFMYDRKEAKLYGDSADKIIVGANKFSQGNRILLIDDVITTGTTKYDAIEKLNSLGKHKIVGLVVLVDRQEKTGDAENVGEKSAVQEFEEKTGVKVFPMLSMQQLFAAAKNWVSKETLGLWVSYWRKYGSVSLE